jgi:phosphoglycerol transferase MdoB-like AlkP superfamily enzyme
MKKKSRPASGKGSKGLSGNIHVVMMIRILIVTALFFVARIFFFLFNFKYFSGAGTGEILKIFIIGIRFDISAILIINAPYILLLILPFRFRYNRVYKGIVHAYFYIINIIALASNYIDLVYFRFTLKRMTADIFNYLGVGGDFGALVPQFLRDFWYVALIWLLSCALLVWWSNRFRIKEPSGARGGKGVFLYYFIQSLLFLVFSFIAIIGIRGGFQLRPVNLITAGNYTTAKNVPLILNTPFSIAKTFSNQALPTVRYFRQEKDLSRIYTPVHKGKPGSFRNYNVMIIIMESFSLEHIGFFNRDLDNGKYAGFTPFLDSLAGKSLAFRGFANGKTSIQGIPALLSSIPSLMNESFIQSSYATDRYASIASLLKPKGYTSAFFHGGTNGTMGFDSYTKIAGFDHYFGRTEYHNEKDYDGKWGIRDEEFFQYAARKTGEMKPPWVVSIFSLSSHHPYYVPSKYRDKFRKGHLPIQESIMYADYSLRKFFESARRMPWFENTLFVITADHTSEGYYPYYQSDAGQYAIPIIYYRHGSDLSGQPKAITQQIDILPSILDHLGFEKDYLAYGTSVFDPAAPRFSIHYIQGIYSLLRDGYLLEFDGTRSTGLFDLRTDNLQRNNLVSKGLPVKGTMELFMKAFIQQYNNRIIENRLTTD